MQPEGNEQKEVVTAVTPVVASETPKKDNVFENTPKKSNGMLIGMIFCLILAIGGIGFGVCAIMEGNVRQADYEKVIADLEMQKNELEEQNEELMAQIASRTITDEDDSGNTEIGDIESEEGFLTIRE